MPRVLKSIGKRNKAAGSQFERDIVHDLKDVLGIDAKRNLSQTRDSGGDIVLDDWVIECKRRASIAAYQWLEQCEASCEPHQQPIVVARADGKKAIAILPWAVFLTLLGNEIEPPEPSREAPQRAG